MTMITIMNMHSQAHRLNIYAKPPCGAFFIGYTDMTKRRFLVQKLVRDNNVQKNEARDVITKFHKLNHEDYLSALRLKLHEEALEVAEAKTYEEMVEEMGDLLEVFETLAQKNGISFQDIKSAQQRKRDSWGGFEQQIYVEHVDVAPSSELMEYVLARPHKYKEVPCD